jgi:uncharacterized SAM-binding protein YcdF (DUF218 family)
MASVTADSRARWQLHICRWTTAILVGLFLVMLGALLLAGRWLQSGTSPVEHADIAVVLAGSYDRTLYAADLYNKGLVQRIVVSRPATEPIQLHLAQHGISVTPEEDVHKRILLRLGVPESAIDFLPGQSLNTREEAAALSRYLGSSDLTAIIITSPINTWRVSFIFGRRFTQRQFQVVATPYEEFDWRWWRNPNSARAVILELVKSVYLIEQEVRQ